MKTKHRVALFELALPRWIFPDAIKTRTVVGLTIALSMGGLWRSDGAPVAQTLLATSIRADSAQLNGNVDPNGVDTAVYFEYGLAANYGSATEAAAFGHGGTTLGAYSEMSKLTANTTYHYRLVASNTTGVSYGGDVSFRTLPLPPTVETLPASSIAANSAQLNGNVNPNGADTTVCFQYGLTTNYGSTTAAGEAGNGATSLGTGAEAGSLPPGTPLHYRIVAHNRGGTTYGSDVAFTTSAQVAGFTMTGLATLNGAAQDHITVAPGAELAGGFAFRAVNGANPGAQMVAILGLVNSANQWAGGIPQVVYAGIPSQSGTTGTVSWVNLMAPTNPGTYSLRFGAYLDMDKTDCINSYEASPPTSNAGTLQGLVAAVTAVWLAPTVQTLPAASITANSARLRGNVNPHGADTTVYFRYGLTTNYAHATGAGDFGSGTRTLEGYSELTRLTANTTYHYCPVGYNRVGLSSGVDASFTTLPPPPTTPAVPPSSTVTNSAQVNRSASPSAVDPTAPAQSGPPTSGGSATGENGS